MAPEQVEGHEADARSDIAVLTTGALAIPATLYFRRPTSEPVVTRLDVVTPPTSDAFSFALSPDGRQLVFVANGEKGSQLWLRPLDEVRAQPLAGTDGASFPFWAPDGRAVGFFAGGKLKWIDLAGGTTASPCRCTLSAWWNLECRWGCGVCAVGR